MMVSRNKGENPFTTSFGKKPVNYISRVSDTEHILQEFTAKNPPNLMYMITGVRGSGKTVMLADVGQKLEEKGWIVIRLNAGTDVLRSFASKLYSEGSTRKLFQNVKFSFSAMGVGFSVEDGGPVIDDETAVSMMLKELKRRGKRVLVTIDEISKTDAIRTFAGAYQILISEGEDLFLLMAGLYENIDELQNDKALTFLYRAPKIVLNPLNMLTIREYYRTTFGLMSQEAKVMAEYTNGYAFAFQVLGYLFWQSESESLENILPEYDNYLQDNVYEKIWFDLTGREKEIVQAIAESENASVRVKEVRDAVGMETPEFSVYRSRLKKKGIVYAEEYGHLSLILPRFREYVLELNR